MARLALPGRSTMEANQSLTCSTVMPSTVRWSKAGMTGVSFTLRGRPSGLVETAVNGNRKLHTFDNRKSDTPDLRSYPQTRCWGCLARCSCG